MNPIELRFNCCYCIWGPKEKDAEKGVCSHENGKFQAREWSLKFMYGIAPNAVGRRRRCFQTCCSRAVLRQRQDPGYLHRTKLATVTPAQSESTPTPHVFDLAPMRLLESVADSSRVSTEEFFNCTGRAFDSELIVMR